MKTFIIEMDEELDCRLLSGYDYSLCGDTGTCCDGNLNNRPDWCPLKEIKPRRDGMCPDDLHVRIMKEVEE